MFIYMSSLKDPPHYVHFLRLASTKHATLWGSLRLVTNALHAHVGGDSLTNTLQYGSHSELSQMYYMLGGRDSLRLA